jgi:hypothetical protein
VHALLTLADVHYAAAAEAAERGDASADAVAAQYTSAETTFAAALERIPSPTKPGSQCEVYRIRASLGLAKVALATLQVRDHSLHTLSARCTYDGGHFPAARRGDRARGLAAVGRARRAPAARRGACGNG